MPHHHTIETRIIGVSYLNFDGTDRQDLLRECTVGQELELARDPQNRFSRTAVKVCRPSGGQLGYVDDAAGSQIAPALDLGKKLRATLVGFSGGAGAEASLGAEIAIDFDDDAASSTPIPVKQVARLGDEYQHILEAALLDGRIDNDEDFQNRVFASGLSEEVRRTVHARIFANVLLDSLRDDVLTEAECDRIRWVREVLEKLGWTP